MNNYSIVHDEKELKWFYDNILPSLKDTEVYFVSLSARNKYLSTEERTKLQLGHTEMFYKTIIRKREWEIFLRTLRKFEVSEGGYTTKNNFNIPQKCLVCYFNINPSNTLLAITNFKRILLGYEEKMASLLFNNRSNSDNIAIHLNKVNSTLMTCFQNNTGTKHWVDFDLDVNKQFNPHNNLKINKFLKDNGINTYYWIDTKSGYHLLVKKDELSFNPKEIVNIIEKEYMIFRQKQNISESYEIIYNSNQMIPLPGTYQANYPVTILNK